MKRFQDYKKLCRLFLFSLFSLISLGTFFIFPISSNAQTADDLTAQINQHNSDISALEQQIAAYQAQLDTIGKQKDSLNSELQTLDINRKKLVANLSVTQNKIDETNLQIQSLSSNIDTKQKDITSDTDAIGLEMRQTNQFDLSSLTETILSENDFSSVWNDVNDMATVGDSIRKDILDLEQVKGQLEDTRTASLKAKADLVALKSQLSDQKKIVDQNTADEKKLLAQTKNSEANYQKLVTDSLARKNALEKEVGDYESQLQYILDPSKLPNKGVLSWPLDTIFVTNLFGKNNSGLYASGLHNGVDFRASVGTPVKAMADGVVAGTGNTDLECAGASFGNFVLIKYNDGLASTFGHLSLIKAHVGDIVHTGDIVGYSGNTGYSTGPHLHVSLYARDAVNVQSLPSKACPGRVLTQPIAPVNAYLDPLVYLPATTSSMFKSTIVKPD